MKNIRVNHIVTSEQGGAYVSARSLHRSLIECNIDSRMYFRDLGARESGFIGNELIKVNLTSKYKSKIFTALQSLFVQKQRELITTFGIDILSEQIHIPQNSILHIHSAYNFINSRGLKDWIKQGHFLILQLHDQRFITGGCHHDLGCEEFKRDCNGCPQVRSLFKTYVSKEKSIIKWILEQETVHVVAPSKYLFEKASAVVPYDRIHLVPNVTNSVPKIVGYDRDKTRERLKIGQSEFVLGFCAANIDSPYKNFDYFREIVQELKNSWTSDLPKLRVLLIGDGGQELQDANPIRFRSDNEHEVHCHIAAMDLLLVPSRIDNVPNVIIEALTVGTPVLASRVGGIPDLLEHLDTDWFLTGVPNLDAKKIVAMTSFNQRDIIKQKSKLTFDRNKVVNRYLELYYAVLSRGNR